MHRQLFVRRSSFAALAQRARHELAERERLLRTLIDIQEKEKQLLCHEIHDGLIQYAVGSKMRLEAIRDRGPPAALDDLGLRAAIDDLVNDLRDAGTAVDGRLGTDIDTIPTPLQTTVYRVVQEALNNPRKHSGSPRVGLRVGRTPTHVSIKIEDYAADSISKRRTAAASVWSACESGRDCSIDRAQ